MIQASRANMLTYPPLIGDFQTGDFQTGDFQVGEIHEMGEFTNGRVHVMGAFIALSLVCLQSRLAAALWFPVLSTLHGFMLLSLVAFRARVRTPRATLAPTAQIP